MGFYTLWRKKKVFLPKKSGVVPFCIDIIFKLIVCVCLRKYAHLMVSPRRMSIQRKSALAYREGKDISQKCILISLFIISFEIYPKV